MLKWVLAAVAALAVQTAGQKADEAPLKPVSSWGVDYGNSLCSLSLDFPGPKGPISLSFAPLTGGSHVKILVAGLPNGKPKPGSAAVSVRADETMERRYYAGYLAKGHRPFVLIKAMRPDLERIGAASVLTIEIEGQKMRFALRGIATALKALDACEVDLAKSWGYDPAAVATPARPINVGTWLTSNDYPDEAMLVGQAGETNYRLTVGPDGKPTGCTVLVRSGSPSLDDRTCRIMKARGRFTPAIGLDGKPVPGIYSAAVIWSIETEF
jgi:TonB family protein